MALAQNTHITLGKAQAKKDASIGTGAPSVGPNEVGIYVSTGVPLNNPQQIIGDLRQVHRYAQTILKTSPTLVRMPLGASDPSIAVGGSPAATDVCVYIGSNISTHKQSHFLDRGFKRLLERWLELGKGPNDAGVAAASVSQVGTNSFEFGGTWPAGTGLAISLKLTDPDGQEEMDTIDWTADQDYTVGQVVAAAAAAIDALVHWTVTINGTSGIMVLPSGDDYVGEVSIQVV